MTKFSPTPDQCRAYFENRLGVNLPSRNQVAARCALHKDRTSSMSINLEKGIWSCHACNLEGGLIDFERKLTGRQDAECWAAINETIGRDAPAPGKSKHGRIVDTYDYHDAAGMVTYQAVRYAEPKEFRQCRPDGNGGWTWNMEGVSRVPFNLPAVVRSNVVLIAEGEKDALTLQETAADFSNEDGTLTYAATTNIGGAGNRTHQRDRLCSSG